MSKSFRQGDVLIVQTDKVPAKSKKVALDKGRVVLAYGEVTGHAHAIDGRAAVLYENKSGDRWLEVTNATQLKHEEHGAIKLAKGTYRVYRQVEYTPGELRNVAD
jgi:hypothetical protein